MRSTSLSTRLACFLGLCLPLVLCAWSVGAPKGVIIKGPEELYLTAGNSVTFLGSMSGARARPAPNDPWEVLYPRVSLEFSHAVFGVLITSTAVDMAFPNSESTQGAWSGALTVQQIWDEVFPYVLYAVPMDQFNDKNHQLSDSALYAVQNPDL